MFNSDIAIAGESIVGGLRAMVMYKGQKNFAPALYISNEKNYKIALIISFLLTLYLIYQIINIQSQKGYEISIIDVFPPLFWVILILCFLIGLYTLYFSIYNGGRTWIISLSLILELTIILILIPYLRGYFFYGAQDALYHIGAINKIIDTGHIFEAELTSYYPILHIYSAQIISIFNLNSDSALYIIPIAYTITYILSAYLLAKIISDNKAKLALIFILFSIPLFGIDSMMFAPFTRSIMLIPLILYLYHSRKINPSIGLSIILIIMIISIAIMHPLSGLFICVIFIGLGISNVLFGRLLQHKLDSESRSLRTNDSHDLIILSITALLGWFTQFIAFKRIAGTIINNITMGMGTSTAEYYSSALTIARPLDLIITAYFQYGVAFILSALSVCLVIVLLIIPILSKKTINKINIDYCVLIVIFGALTLAFFLIDLVANTGMRPLMVLSILTIPLLGLWMGKKSYEKIKPIMVGLLILALIVPATLGFHVSPIAKGTSWQIPDNEALCIQWSITKNPKDMYYSANLDSFAAFFGMNISSAYGYIDPVSTIDIPAHFEFNYSNNPSKIDQYFMIIDKRIETVYPTLFSDYPNNWKFNPTDFIKINYNSSIGLIYSTSETTVWMINFTSK